MWNDVASERRERAGQDLEPQILLVAQTGGIGKNRTQSERLPAM